MDLVPIHIYILHQNIMEIWRVKINEPQIHADDFLYVVKVKIALSIYTLRWAINKKQEHKYWNKLSGINIEGWIYYIFEWVVVITTLNYLMKICIKKESFSSLGFKYTYAMYDESLRYYFSRVGTPIYVTKKCYQNIVNTIR